MFGVDVCEFQIILIVTDDQVATYYELMHQFELAWYCEVHGECTVPAFVTHCIMTLRTVCNEG